MTEVKSCLMDSCRREATSHVFNEDQMESVTCDVVKSKHSIFDQTNGT